MWPKLHPKSLRFELRLSVRIIASDQNQANRPIVRCHLLGYNIQTKDFT